MKKIMNKFLSGLGILAITLAIIAVPVLAAETAGVDATVTAQLIAVSVSDGSVAYGTLTANTKEDTTINGVNQSQIATNDSNITADLGIRSSDALSGVANWNLAAAAGTDAYTHDFCVTNCDTSPVWVAFNVDNTTNSGLSNGIASSGTQVFDLRVGTPTSSTDFVGHTITVTVQVSAQ